MKSAKYLVLTSMGLLAVMLPVRGATKPLSAVERYDYVPGTQAFGQSYQFSKEPMLLESARAMLEMGSNTIKFKMDKNYFGKNQNVPVAAKGIANLTQLARDEKTHRQVFDMPFANYLLWAGAMSSGGWKEGFAKADADKEYREIYDFTRYLLQTYNGTGKKFYLGHWEGDWLLHVGYKADVDPTPAAIQGMTDWLNTRQRAIDDAKRDTKHRDVQVYQYTEVNLVRKAMAGGKSLTNSVLPNTNVDFVSYSSYDSLGVSDVESSLIEALNFIESKLKPKPQISGKRVFIGEYGFPARSNSPEAQDRKSRRVMRAAIRWGCPFALYWQLYNNEVDANGQKGFWLIDDKGVKQPVYHTHKKFLTSARQYVTEFERQNRRVPTRPEFSKQAMNWLLVAEPSAPVKAGTVTFNGTDNFLDFSKPESYTGTLNLDKTNPNLFNGSASRVRRGLTDTPQSLIYKVEGAPYFKVDSYVFGGFSNGDKNKVRVYVSGDGGKSWQEIAVQPSAPVRTDANWSRVVLTSKEPLKAGTTHLKIELRDDPKIYSPQLAQVVVSPESLDDSALVKRGSELILSRYREIVLAGKPTDEAVLMGWLNTLDAGGQWPDIDYADKMVAAWKTSDHLVRIKALSLALAQKTPIAKDPRLEPALLRAVDHWVAKRYKNSNWWHNDIGVPMLMRDIIVLLGDRLQGARRAGALEVLNQYGRPSAGGGANTIWQAELAIEYGALTNDGPLIEKSSRLIADEIKIANVEGIKPDWSFHAHGARLQQFHYGGSYLHDGARLGRQLSGTPWALPDAKLELLAKMVIEGGQWMVRGPYTVPATIDRSVSRPGALRSGDMRTPLRNLREALPQYAAQFDAITARQDGKGTPLVGFRDFPVSDFTTYHRPSFSFFLKPVSDRTFLTEFGGNGENLKGQRLSNGDHYIMRDGEEYFNLPPLWNWDLLPGVTWAKDAATIRRLPFVGSVSDGTSGATAMDYSFGPAQNPTLSARKFYAAHGDVVVALTGDLRAPQLKEPVRTALDQSLQRGAVTIADENGAIKQLEAGSSRLAARWVQHSGMAYFPIGGLPLTVQTGPVTGAWVDINKSGSPTPITQPMFLPVLEHGIAPAGQASGYAIAAAPTVAQAAQIWLKPTWKILHNDANTQAIKFADGTVMAVFYAAGTVSEVGKPLFTADKPCLVFWKEGQLRASDPTHKGGVVNVTDGQGRKYAITMPAGGVSSAPTN